MTVRTGLLIIAAMGDVEAFPYYVQARQLAEYFARRKSPMGERAYLSRATIIAGKVARRRLFEATYDQWYGQPFKEPVASRACA